MGQPRVGHRGNHFVGASSKREVFPGTAQHVAAVNAVLESATLSKHAGSRSAPPSGAALVTTSASTTTRQAASLARAMSASSPKNCRKRAGKALLASHGGSDSTSGAAFRAASAAASCVDSSSGDTSSMDTSSDTCDDDDHGEDGSCTGAEEETESEDDGFNKTKGRRRTNVCRNSVAHSDNIAPAHAYALLPPPTALQHTAAAAPADTAAEQPAATNLVICGPAYGSSSCAWDTLLFALAAVLRALPTLFAAVADVATSSKVPAYISEFWLLVRDIAVQARGTTSTALRERVGAVRQAIRLAMERCRVKMQKEEELSSAVARLTSCKEELQKLQANLAPPQSTTPLELSGAAAGAPLRGTSEAAAEHGAQRRSGACTAASMAATGALRRAEAAVSAQGEAVVRLRSELRALGADAATASANHLHDFALASVIRGYAPELWDSKHLEPGVILTVMAFAGIDRFMAQNRGVLVDFDDDNAILAAAGSRRDMVKVMLPLARAFGVASPAQVSEKTCSCPTLVDSTRGVTLAAVVTLPQELRACAQHGCFASKPAQASGGAAGGAGAAVPSSDRPRGGAGATPGGAIAECCTDVAARASDLLCHDRTVHASCGTAGCTHGRITHKSGAALHLGPVLLLHNPDPLEADESVNLTWTPKDAHSLPRAAARIMVGGVTFSLVAIGDLGGGHWTVRAVLGLSSNDVQTFEAVRYDDLQFNAAARRVGPTDAVTGSVAGASDIEPPHAAAVAAAVAAGAAPGARPTYLFYVADAFAHKPPASLQLGPAPGAPLVKHRDLQDSKFLPTADVAAAALALTATPTRDVAARLMAAGLTESDVCAEVRLPACLAAAASKVDVTFKAARRVASGWWLNDPAIEYATQALAGGTSGVLFDAGQDVSAPAQILPTGPSCRSYCGCLSSFVAVCLNGKDDLSRTAQYLRNVLVHAQRDALPALQYLLVPLNAPNCHWALAAVDVVQGTIFLLDSYRSGDVPRAYAITRQVHRLALFMRTVGHGLVRSAWPRVAPWKPADNPRYEVKVVRGYPQQPNTDDCGMYVVMALYCFSHGCKWPSMLLARSEPTRERCVKRMRMQLADHMLGAMHRVAQKRRQRAPAAAASSGSDAAESSGSETSQSTKSTDREGQPRKRARAE